MRSARLKDGIIKYPALQKPLDLLPVLSEGIMPTTQPVRSLFRISTNYLTQTIQIHPHRSLVPRKPANSIIRAVEWNITWKFGNSLIILQFWFGAMLPVPDRGLGDAGDLSDLPLEETEIHSFLADVVTNCDGEPVVSPQIFLLNHVSTASSGCAPGS